MPGNLSVLVVDPLEETREVLRTALERLGFRILSAARADDGLEMARRHHPDLIVLDLEVAESDESPAGELVRQSQADGSHLVVLGSARQGRHSGPGDEFIRKPYHYAPLIRRIEALLAHRRHGVGVHP